MNLPHILYSQGDMEVSDEGKEYKIFILFNHTCPSILILYLPFPICQ